MGTDNESIPVVRDWIDAVNAADMEGADRLVADTVSIVGPRGSTSGRNAVSGWIHHTQIRMSATVIRLEGNRVIAGVSAT
jgi:ketosteroid isomerase-like protein